MSYHQRSMSDFRKKYTPRLWSRAVSLSMRTLGYVDNYYYDKAIKRLTDAAGRPVIYCDVGALWGLSNEKIRSLNKWGIVHVVGFEPDQTECERLNTRSKNGKYFPYCLGSADGTQTLYLTNFDACSSLLKPNAELLDRFVTHKGLFIVKDEIEVRVARYDTLIRENNAPLVDFIKVDTQGFDIEVLKGFGDYLDHIIGIEVETHTQGLYDGEPPFGELLKFMSDKGFILRDLRPTAQFDHELLEFDAFFSKDPKTSTDAQKTLIALWDATHEIPPGRYPRTTKGFSGWVRI
jgi:FkbM family methyltransferase